MLTEPISGALPRSEFYRLTLSTSVIAIDIAGGLSVVLQAQGDMVRISTTPAQDDYFLLQDSFGAGGPVPPLTVPSHDQRLYVRADSGASVLCIWVVR